MTICWRSWTTRRACCNSTGSETRSSSIRLMTCWPSTVTLLLPGNLRPRDMTPSRSSSSCIKVADRWSRRISVMIETCRFLPSHPIAAPHARSREARACERLVRDFEAPRQCLDDILWDELVDGSSERRDFPDDAGTDESVIGPRHQADNLKIRVQVLIHVTQLELVLEVRYRP